VAADLVDVVAKSGRHLDQATRLAEGHPDGARYLTPQLDALRDLLAVTKPNARAAFTHLNTAHNMTSRAAGQWIDHAADATPLHQTVITVGHEVARADEDVRLADVAVDRIHGAAARTANLALEINDTARSRMAAEQQRPAGAGPAAGGDSPGR